jgi:hypothetical protein
LGVSPASETIRALDEWQIGLIYETAMNYPIEGMRQSYWKRKNSAANFDDGDLADLGYSPEEIAEIKGQ